MEWKIKYTGRYHYLHLFNRLSLLFSCFLLFASSCSNQKTNDEIETNFSTIDEILTDTLTSNITTIDTITTIPNPQEEIESITNVPDKPQNTTNPTITKPTSASSSSEQINFSELRSSGSGIFDASHPDWGTGTGQASPESTRTRLNGVNLEHLDIVETGKIFLRLEVDASGNVLRGNCVMNETTINDTEFILKVIDAAIDQVKYKKTQDGKTTFEYFTIYVKKK
jgi:hypothetical protein